MPLSKIKLCLLGAVLATSVVTIGCQPQSNSGQNTTQPQPTPDETVIYNKWEVETNRPHKDLNQRPPEEQKEYHDWRQKQPNAH
jgi:hypothetical protein